MAEAPPCVEVRTDSGTLIVIDCGSGGHDLGQSLQSSGRGARGHLLISHTHWDHIQGIPFFAPLFVPGNRWDIYAPRGVRQSLEQTLAGQMQSTYFPVDLEELGADIRFHELVEGDLEIEEARVATRYLNHPALTLGYRLSSRMARRWSTPATTNPMPTSLPRAAASLPARICIMPSSSPTPTS